jgi:hypothetical protein
MFDAFHLLPLVVLRFPTSVYSVHVLTSVFILIVGVWGRGGGEVEKREGVG